jgi:hypothetical protein
MYIGLHVKYPLFLSDCNETLIFLTGYRNILKYQNFMEIRPVGAELFHADEQTGIKRLTLASRNFAKAPINSCIISFVFCLRTP